MTDTTSATGSAVAELARALLDAAADEPGRVSPSLRSALERAGVPASDRDDLHLALRDAQVLGARLRRRTQELEALFSTARELVRLQDVNDVLRRLVQRAHDLMGTDVTYLSELDPATGDLRVRHSVGTVTPEFRDLRVPSGYGLASMVVRTREPAWTARYTRMSDAPHHTHIDAAVDAEGLVSFLGVPLMVGDEVLGALFACNRFAHESSPDEVLLLSAFADHAAAVLHSARVLADSAAATARAEHAYSRLEEHLAATELASSVHEELTTAVMTGGSVIDVVATLSRSLERSVWAIDELGRPLLDGDGEPLPPRDVLARAVATSTSSGHVAVLAAGRRTWLVAAILGADRVLGAIVTEQRQDAALDAVARRSLERAAHIAALVSFKQDAVRAIRAERRAGWLLTLLDRTGAGDAESAAAVAAPAEFCGVAVLDVGESRAAAAAAIAGRAAGDDGFVAHRDAHVLIAWSGEDPTAATERVRRVVADALREPGLLAVVRTRTVPHPEFAAAVARVGRDAASAAAVGLRGATVDADALAPYHVLAPSDPQTVERFIGGLLDAVLRWDAQRDTRLFDTLTAYFDAGGNRSAVADALHVHKNTVQQRLERIHALLTGDLSDPEYRFRLESAVRLERLRRSAHAAAR